MAGEGLRPQGRKIAVNLKDCRKQGERNHFGAEIRASNVIALRFKNSFARSSMVKARGALPEGLGRAEELLADNGYYSEANVACCGETGIAPLISMGREKHHSGWKARFQDAPPAPENPTPLQAMAHRLATKDGKQLYALRKQIPEPVFGIIKSVIGFRQFSLRGLEKVKGEW